MEITQVETKYTFLMDRVDRDGVSCPIIREVSVFSDGSVHLKEYMSTPWRDIVLDYDNSRNLSEFSGKFPEMSHTIHEYWVED
jgi:hypothetical protein